MRVSVGRKIGLRLLADAVCNSDVFNLYRLRAQLLFHVLARFRSARVSRRFYAFALFSLKNRIDARCAA